MMQDANWGPHAEWDDLMADMRTGDDPLARTEQIEELMRYDGVMIDLRRSHDGSVWLSYTYDDGDRPREGVAVDMLYATHALRVGDVEAMRATLNEGYLPTEESYRMAETIVAERLTYVLEDGRSRDCRGSRRTITVDEAFADGAIYRQIRPDGRMTFGPFADGRAPLQGEDIDLYRYPVPEDRLLYSFDGPRIWTGTFEGRREEFHLVCSQGEESDHEEQHRLTFPSTMEEEVMATLAWKRVPTMDTYRLATAIHLERLEHRTEGTVLIVKRIGIDDPDFDRPTYENVAAHDAEWPDYAKDA